VRNTGLGRHGVHVEKRILVRILAVPQAHAAGIREHERPRAILAGKLVREVARDGGVVLRRAGIHFLGQLATQFRRCVAAVLPHRIQHTAIIRRIADHGHRAVIFRGGAEHRRPADVDVLDRLLERHSGFADGRLEPVQVHTDEIDRQEAVLVIVASCCALPRRYSSPPWTFG